MCFGGGSAPAPASPPPPPQYAVAPNAAATRSTVQQQINQQLGSTLLTSGLGDQLNSNQLGRKTLLGQ